MSFPHVQSAAGDEPHQPAPAHLPSVPPLLRAMTVPDVDSVVSIEQRVYAFPWSHGNFIDSLAAGYLAQLLVAGGSQGVAGGGLIGYYLAMPGVDEMHLLNITVAPGHEHQGHARRMLAHLVAASRDAGISSLWLEVRESNHRAHSLYERWGFQAVGQRKGYYPAPHGQREHAIVMSLSLDAADGRDA